MTEIMRAVCFSPYFFVPFCLLTLAVDVYLVFVAARACWRLWRQPYREKLQSRAWDNFWRIRKERGETGPWVEAWKKFCPYPYMLGDAYAESPFYWFRPTYLKILDRVLRVLNIVEPDEDRGGTDGELSLG